MIVSQSFSRGDKSDSRVDLPPRRLQPTVSAGRVLTLNPMVDVSAATEMHLAFNAETPGADAYSACLTADGVPILPSESACLKTVFSLIASKMDTCPCCDSTPPKFHRLRTRKAFICQSCGHKIHPCANTILGNSSTSLTKWVQAMYLMSSSSGSISARKLQLHLNITYKCAWRIRGLLSATMHQKFPLLHGWSFDRGSYLDLLHAYLH